MRTAKARHPAGAARARARRRLLQGLLLAFAPGCRFPARHVVVVYTSLDEPYARPVFEAFQRETGVRAFPVYDTEAGKSRGLAERLRAERRLPRADVFWSSEVLQMLRLQQEGLLEPYQPSAAAAIPAHYRSPDGDWTGFAARFRVLAANARRVTRPPRSLLELTEPRWRNEVAMANPLFGTSTTEAAAIFQVLGAARAREYYRARKHNGTRIVDGNSVSADQAARGEVLVAQTDTDDAFIRQTAPDGKEVLRVVFPDQQPGGMGTLLIPNTAALIRGAPNVDNGRKFLNFLLRPETELLLAGLPARQLPLHPLARQQAPAPVRAQISVRPMEVDYSRLATGYEEVEEFLRATFLR